MAKPPMDWRDNLRFGAPMGLADPYPPEEIVTDPLPEVGFDIHPTWPILRWRPLDDAALRAGVAAAAARGFVPDFDRQTNTRDVWYVFLKRAATD